MAERGGRYRARRLQRMIAARSASAPSRFRVEGIVAIGIAMLISTLYTASEFNFISTGKLPHKIEILVAYASARIIWKPDNF
ncbi:hypothetical protein IGI04_015109 [Brassica rapa subsp. trilocularis]|uniref:CASP-like protein n=1 Tax=Brassica rapa subsp. trilocularis TaxID=1813537 RepID=A0ABQ7MP45_BRACM|nr:hypothetical protein IGI04_015109 [Brassica rapa subsp. trilocularis]